MYTAAMGERVSWMRMIIGVNQLNDPGGDRSTARLEADLAAEVRRDQELVDQVAPGLVTVVGHLIDLPVLDGQDRVVDGDVWRQLRAGGRRLKYKLNFPHAGVQHAMVASRTFQVYMEQLGRSCGEVFAHFGDSDVVSLVNPRGGNTRSVFDRFAEEISRSRVDGRPSPLVRVGGAVGYSAAEVDGHRDGVGDGAEPSFEAKLTVLLAEVHQIWAEVLSRGVYPMGYFTEQNTLINTRFLGDLLKPDGEIVSGLLPSMSQDTAQRVGGFDFNYGVHRELRRLGLSSDRSVF